jgi:RHS repeat-associated protein
MARRYAARTFCLAVLASAIFASQAAAAPILLSGFPVSQNNPFQGPSTGPAFGYAAAVDSQTLNVWAAGSAFNSANQSQSGAVLVYDAGGRLRNALQINLGISGGTCFVGNIDYCVAGSSSVVNALALDSALRQLWAAGTQYDPTGQNPVLFVANIDLDAQSVSFFLVNSSTGTTALGAGVASGGDAWIVGSSSGAPELWSADAQAGLEDLGSFASAGTANGVVETSSGGVWAAGKSGQTNEMALWNYDPNTGTVEEYLWSNDLGGSFSSGKAIILSPLGSPFIAGIAASSTRQEAIVWSFSGGAFTEAASTGAYNDAAYGLTEDAAGNIWASGSSAIDAQGDQNLALWEEPSGQNALNLAAAYDDPAFTQTPYSNQGRSPAYIDGEVWIAGTLDNDVFGLWAYALNTGNIAGTLSYAGGFSGHNLDFVPSLTPSFGNVTPIALPAPTSQTSASSYTIAGLAAPATYYLAAVYDITGSLGQGFVPSSDPLGLYQDNLNGVVTQIMPIFVPAGGQAVNINFTLALDTQAPIISAASPIAGSTITPSLFDLYGTATDDTGVTRVSLAIEDISASSWWNGSSFISTTSVPLYGIEAQTSGPINSISWNIDPASLNNVSAALQSGHSYAAFIQAQDVVGKTSVATIGFIIQSTAVVQGTSNGQALLRDSSGNFWVAANDYLGGQAVNFRLLRYNSAGSFISSAALSGAGGNSNFGTAFDSSGNIWVSGGVSSGSISGLGIWEFNSNSVFLASSAYFSSSGGSIFTGKLSIDGSQNAWVPAAEAVLSGGYRADLFKFAPNAILSAGFPVSYQRGGGLDGGVASAVDGSGNIWSAGVSSNPATGKLDMALWKYSPSGALASGFPVFWPDTYPDINQFHLALTINLLQNQLWIATQKSFSNCSAPDFALLSYNLSGEQTSQNLWHASLDLGSEGEALSLDSYGDLWVVGESSPTSALWEYDPSGNLISGYPLNFYGGLNFSQNSVAIDGAQNPWVLFGDIPNLFQPGPTIPGSSGASLCSLTGLGQISGVITNSAGFILGSTVSVVASTNPFFGNSSQIFTLTTSSAATLSYALTLQAPATYFIAAVNGVIPNGPLPSSAPVGVYNHFSPISLSASNNVSAIDFSLSPDTIAPTSGVDSFISGSTLTAIASIAGTASDDVGVGGVSIAAEDASANLWWNAQSQQWISTTTTPLFQGFAALSGTPYQASWTQYAASSSQPYNNFGDFAGFLATGHEYRIFSEAQDFSGLFESTSSALAGSAAFFWQGPNGAVPPGAPQNIQGFALGVSSIVWNWQNSGFSSGYDVYQGTAALLAQVSQNSFNEVGLSTNAAQEICVIAFNQYGQSPESCGPAVFSAASIPANLGFVSVTSTTINLSWNSNGNPLSSTTYQAELSTDNFTGGYIFFSQVSSSPAAAFSFLTPDTSYYAEVQAFNGNNVPSAFSAVIATQTAPAPPPPPANILGAALGISSIAWTWNAAPSAVSYDVYSSSGGFLASASTTSFVQVGLSTGEASFICVSGVNAIGAGPKACAPSAYALDAPTGPPFFSDVSFASFSVTWDTQGDPFGTIYQINLSTDDFVQNVSTPVPFSSNLLQNTTALLGLNPDTTYYLRVEAQNGAGVNTAFSPASLIRTLLPPPNAPVNLSAVPDGPRHLISLSWQTGSGGVLAAAFDIFRAAYPSSGTFTLIASTSSTSYDDSLFYSDTFYYQVAGVNLDGVIGPVSQTAAVLLDVVGPNAVTDLRVYSVNLASSQITLAWTAPSDDVTNVSAYFLKESSLPINSLNFDALPNLAAAMAPQAPGSTETLTVSVSSASADYFLLKSSDAAGNISGPSNLLLYDPVPPTVAISTPAPGSIIGRPFTVLANASDPISGISDVIFSVNGVILATATSAPYEFFWNTPDFADGNYVLSAAALDNAQNTGISSITVTLSYVPPAAPVILFPANGFITDVSTINIYGTAEPGTTVQVMVNNLDLSTTPVSAQGFWSLNAALPFEGDVALSAVAFDDRGFSAPSPSVNGVFSTGYPNPPQALSADAVSGGQVDLAWSAPVSIDPAASYSLYRSTDSEALVEGSSVAANPLLAGNLSSFTYTDAPAIDNLYYYGATSVDGIGRESVLSNIAYALTDRVPPTAQILFSTSEPVGPGVYSPQLLLSETLSAPPSLAFTPPGGQTFPLDIFPITDTLWQASVTITTSMSSGTALFSFQGTDLAGNTGTALSSAALVIRTVGPVGTVILSKTSPVGPGALGITLSLDEPAASTPSLAILLSSGSLPVPLSQTAPFNGKNWFASPDIATTTPNGTASFSYSASDQFGNLSSTLSGGTTAFIIATIPPTAPLSLFANPKPLGYIHLSWSAPLSGIPAFYSVYRDSVKLSTEVFPAPDGTGTYDDLPPQGTRLYQVSALDAAGNESALSNGAEALSQYFPPPPPIDVSLSSNSAAQPVLSWTAASTDTVSFNLYRSTSPLISLIGNLIAANAVSPYADSPTEDASYYYGVTALDAAGNESAASTTTAFLYAQGAPQIAILGVSDGGVYNHDVFPNDSIFDLALNAASVQTLLNGANFVAGSTVSAEGNYTFSISAANLAGHVSTASASFAIDLTPPAISFSGVSPNAFVRSSAPISIAITVFDLHPGTSAFILSDQTLNSQETYLSGEAISKNGFYVLSGTATDAAGNISTASLSFTFEIGPSSPLNLAATIENGAASLSWQSPEPDVAGYRVYKNGARLSSSLFTGTIFGDPNFSQGPQIYQVTAVDQNGVEGPPAKITIPNVALTYNNPITLTRGFFDDLSPQVQNSSTQTLTIGPAFLTVTDSNGTIVNSTAAALSVLAGQTQTLEAAIATPASFASADDLHVAANVPTDPGSILTLAADFPMSAQNPKLPIVEAFPGTLIANSLSPVSVKIHNRGSAPMDIISAQVQNSTFAAAANVSASLASAQGALLSTNGLLQTDNGAVSTFLQGSQIFFVRVPAGESAILDPVSVSVPNSQQNVELEVSLSTPYYNLDQTLPGQTLAQNEIFQSSASQAVVSPPPYNVTVFASSSVYDQGSVIALSGQALDPTSGFPVPNAQVSAHVVSNGFTRSLSAVTDSSGDYAALFYPSPNEAGVYELWAGAPETLSAQVSSSFTIVGLAIQYSTFTAVIAQNSSLKFTVNLTNVGETAIAGISASSASVIGSGVTLSLDTSTLPQTLAAETTATLSLTLSAAPAASTSTISLTISESHGFTRTMIVSVEVVPAQIFPEVTPQSFQLGLLGGTSKTQAVTVQNLGYQTWQNVAIASSALPSWITIAGNSNLGDLAPGANIQFSLVISPPAGLPNQTYNFNPLLSFLSSNFAPIHLPASIAVTSSLTGNVLVSAINADEPKNSSGQGVPVPGAKVTLTSLDVQGFVLNAAADSNGLATLSAIPSGNYSWTVQAQGFLPVTGTAVIQPGLDNQIQAVLPTATVTYTWSVTPTTIVDQYNITLNLTFLTNVQAPAIVVSPAVFNLTMTDGQTLQTQFSITNKGLIAADNYQLNFSGDPAIQVQLPFTSITRINAGQTVMVPINITLVHASCHSATIAQSYGYTCAYGTPVNAGAQGVSINAGQGCAGAASGGGGGIVGGGAASGATGGPGADFGLPGVSQSACGPAALGSNNNTPGLCPGMRGTNPLYGLFSYDSPPFGYPPGSPPPVQQPHYRSDSNAPSESGYSWTHATAEASIQTNPDGSQTLVHTDESGASQNIAALAPLNQAANGFSSNGSGGGSGQFAMPVNFYTKFSFLNNALTETRKNGTVIHYQAFGPLGSQTYLPTQLTDRNGNALNYSRDSLTGALLKETDVHNRSLNFSYNGSGQISAVSDGAGRSISYGYDSSGNKISDTDALGDQTGYSYDSSHRLTQITEPNGGHWNVVYNSTGQPLSESRDFGVLKRTYAYFESSSTVADSLGHETIYFSTASEGLIKPARIQDPLGNVSSYVYDSNMNLAGQTDALGRTTRMNYDNNGNLILSVDAEGGQTETVYDPTFNHPTQTTDPLGNRTQMTYDARGNLIAVVDPLQNQSRMSYDSFGHVAQTQDPLGGVTSFSYDANGALSQLKDPLGRTTLMTRDALSRVTQNTDPAGNKTNFSYDAMGNLLGVTDALSHQTAYNYTPGRPERLLNKVTDADSHSTSFNYDVNARLTAVTNALSQSKNFSYDTENNLISVTDPDGHNISFSYDADNRLTTKTLPEGAVNYSYDAVGNLISVQSYNGSSIQTTYDAMNRPSQVIEKLPSGFSATISYTYDLDGNKTSMTTPWGSFSYAYDADNRETSVTNPQGKKIAFTYDADGHRIGLAYPNGISTSYGYDAASELTQIIHQKNGTAIAFANYNYDADGNRTSMQTTDGANSYSYDALNRLISASHPAASLLPIQNESFAYDPVGNREADSNITAYNYNAANELVSNSSFTYSYDANGNLISKTDLAGNKTSYSYDSENELISVAFSFSPLLSVTFRYDALGRRIYRSTGTLPSQTIQYVYDNQDILAMLDGNNNLIALFTHGPGIDEPLEIRQANGTEYFLHADGLGSIIAATDANGSVVETYEYEAYGKPIIKNRLGTVFDQSTIGNPFLFTAREYDPETGLYFYRARYYDPVAGRFIQRDPIGFQGGGINLYAYVTNQPLRYRDPKGTTENWGGLFSCLYNVGLGNVSEELANYFSQSWATLTLGEEVTAIIITPEFLATEITAIGGSYAVHEAMGCIKKNYEPPPKICPYIVPGQQTQIAPGSEGPVIEQGGPVIAPRRTQ